MKVVAKVTMTEKIINEINCLRQKNKEPDYIVVSESEYASLLKDWNVHRYIERTYRDYAGCSPTTEVRIRTYEFSMRHEVKDESKRHRISVASFEKFMGVDLVVVPEDYHPY